MVTIMKGFSLTHIKHGVKKNGGLSASVILRRLYPELMV